MVLTSHRPPRVGHSGKQAGGNVVTWSKLEGGQSQKEDLGLFHAQATVVNTIPLLPAPQAPIASDTT